MRTMLPILGGARLAPFFNKEYDVLENRLRRWMHEPLFTPLTPFAETVGWAPPVELVEHDDEFVLTAELPGAKLEDIEITLEENVLTLKGEKRRFEEFEDEKCHVFEREYGTFTRSFMLPRATKAQEVKATFRDGILVVHVPKAAESRGRKIEIETR